MTFVKLHKPHIAYRVPGSQFSIGRMTPERIVLHTTETGKLSDPPLADIHAVVNGWLATPLPGRLGAQFIVDGHGNIGQTAKATEITQHTGGFNTGSIGIEQVAFASFTARDWANRPMQLEKVARLIAYLHTRYRIPIEHTHATECGVAGAGVLTHADCSRVCSLSEGHTDPGEAYPLAAVLARAHAIALHGGWSR